MHATTKGHQVHVCTSNVTYRRLQVSIVPHASLSRRLSADRSASWHPPVISAFGSFMVQTVCDKPLEQGRHDINVESTSTMR